LLHNLGRERNLTISGFNRRVLMRGARPASKKLSAAEQRRISCKVCKLLLKCAPAYDRLGRCEFFQAVNTTAILQCDEAVIEPIAGLPLGQSGHQLLVCSPAAGVEPYALQ
jgi:hypothetical protein